MQYTITEKLKRLMYKILVAFLGVMFTCFSGVAQEELSVLADIGSLSRSVLIQHCRRCRRHRQMYFYGYPDHHCRRCGSFIRVIPEENKIVGYTTRNSGGVPDNFKNYFVVEDVYKRQW